MENSAGPSPLLLIGAGRSGTTLLLRMLDAHPLLDFRGETDFLAYRLWQQIHENRFWFEWGRMMAVEPQDSFCELAALEPRQQMDLRAKCGAIVERAVRAALDVSGERVWGYKEIWNGAGGRTVPWEPYDDIFPRAQWVHLVRNPMAFALSCARWRRDRPERDYLRQRCADWVAMVRMSRLRAATGRFHEIRYEDLTGDAEAVLTPVLQACGLPWNDACARAAERTTFATAKGARTGGSRVTLAEFTAEVSGLAELCAELGYATASEWVVPEVASKGSAVKSDLRNGVPFVHVELKGFKHDGGYAWFARMPQCRPLSDTVEQPRRSPIRLLEGPNEIGPAHALHEAIRRVGGGAYSHWGDGIYLSASDGSNPNTNGRLYCALVPVRRPDGASN